MLKQRTMKKVPVKTLLRLRPLLPNEGNELKCIRLSNQNSDILGGESPASTSLVHLVNHRKLGESFQYSFDICLGEEASQEQVFQQTISLVESIFEGRNATIFAYGITGAGKTFTMEGQGDHKGVIPLAAERLLLNCQKKSASEKSFQLFMSHLEIYNEKVYDLNVATASGATDLPIRQDSHGNIIVVGLTEVPISSMADFERHFERTRRNRSTASTLLNSCSSRSHSILCFTLKCTVRGSLHFVSKLHLIDLAGSEDNRKTGNDKSRMIESSNINKSLFNLSLVVDALNSGAINVPYRNSKLTRLLQDSLGGKSSALMIINIAPSAKFYLDTLNSLNLATRTRQIVNDYHEIDVDASIIANTSCSSSNSILSQLETFDLRKISGKRLVPLPEVKQTTSKATVDPIAKILEVATPKTKQGILRAMKKVQHVDDKPIASLESTSNTVTSLPKKRTLNELCSNYPMRALTLDKRLNTDKHPIGEVLPEQTQEQIENLAPNSTQPTTIHYEKIEKALLEILNCGEIRRIRKLRGIGEARAQNIIAYEQQNGPYTSTDQLRNVGIGEKVAEKLVKAFFEEHA